VTEQETVVNDLLAITRTQYDNIEKLTETIRDIKDQVDERPTTRRVYKLGAILGFILVGVFAVVTYLTYDSSTQTLTQLKECIDPTGECAEQSAAASKVVRGQVICNQEKVLYFVYGPEGLYEPLPLCNELINTEIDRLAEIDKVPEGIERLPIDPDVEQIPSFKEDFLGNVTRGI